jgi:hypothetical protein
MWGIEAVCRENTMQARFMVPPMSTLCSCQASCQPSCLDNNLLLWCCLTGRAGHCWAQPLAGVVAAAAAPIAPCQPPSTAPAPHLPPSIPPPPPSLTPPPAPRLTLRRTSGWGQSTSRPNTASSRRRPPGTTASNQLHNARGWGWGKGKTQYEHRVCVCVCVCVLQDHDHVLSTVHQLGVGGRCWRWG